MISEGIGQKEGVYPSHGHHLECDNDQNRVDHDLIILRTNWILNVDK